MMQTLCLILSLFSACCCASAKTLDDDVSLIHRDIENVKHHRGVWPDIAAEAKKAADAVEKAVERSVEGAATATSTAIQSVVQTGQSALLNVQQQAYVFGNATHDEVEKLIQAVTSNSTVKDFTTAANATLDGFLRSFIPMMAGVNATKVALTTVLNAAGFLYLSQETSSYLSGAVDALNESSQSVMLAMSSLESLNEKANATQGKLTRAVNKELKDVQAAVQGALAQVNATFRKKLTQGFELVVSHLKATVEGVLPAQHIKAINETLTALMPEVASIVMSVAEPVVELGAAFNKTIEKVRADMKDILDSESSARAVGRSLVVLAASACAFSLMH